VSEAERSIVSEAERLRLGRSSGGNTASLELVETASLELVETAGQPHDKPWPLELSSQPPDDGYSRTEKPGFWNRVDLADARSLHRDIYLPFTREVNAGNFSTIDYPC
jgi:hypothetical protein